MESKAGSSLFRERSTSFQSEKHSKSFILRRFAEIRFKFDSSLYSVFDVRKCNISVLGWGRGARGEGGGDVSFESKERRGLKMT